MANAAYQAIGGGLAPFHRDDLDGRGLVVGSEDDMTSGDFDVPHRASIVFQNSVHVEFAFVIRLK